MPEQLYCNGKVIFLYNALSPPAKQVVFCFGHLHFSEHEKLQYPQQDKSHKKKSCRAKFSAAAGHKKSSVEISPSKGFLIVSYTLSAASLRGGAPPSRARNHLLQQFIAYRGHLPLKICLNILKHIEKLKSLRILLTASLCMLWRL